VTSTSQRKIYYFLRGRRQGHVAHFVNLGPPPVSGKDKSRRPNVVQYVSGLWQLVTANER